MSMELSHEKDPLEVRLTVEHPLPEEEARLAGGLMPIVVEHLNRYYEQHRTETELKDRFKAAAQRPMHLRPTEAPTQFSILALRPERTPDDAANNTTYLLAALEKVRDTLDQGVTSGISECRRFITDILNDAFVKGLRP